MAIPVTGFCRPLRTSSAPQTMSGTWRRPRANVKCANNPTSRPASAQSSKRRSSPLPRRGLTTLPSVHLHSLHRVGLVHAEEAVQTDCVTRLVSHMKSLSRTIASRGSRGGCSAASTFSRVQEGSGVQGGGCGSGGPLTSTFPGDLQRRRNSLARRKKGISKVVNTGCH